MGAKGVGHRSSGRGQPVPFPRTPRKLVSVKLFPRKPQKTHQGLPTDSTSPQSIDTGPRSFVLCYPLKRSLFRRFVSNAPHGGVRGSQSFSAPKPLLATGPDPVPGDWDCGGTRDLEIGVIDGRCACVT